MDIILNPFSGYFVVLNPFKPLIDEPDFNFLFNNVRNLSQERLKNMTSMKTEIVALKDNIVVSRF